MKQTIISVNKRIEARLRKSTAHNLAETEKLKEEVNAKLSAERIRVAKKEQKRSEKRRAKRLARGRPPLQSVIPADYTAWDAWEGGGMSGVVHYWVLRLVAPLPPRAQIWIGGLIISTIVTSIFGVIAYLLGISLIAGLLFGIGLVCLVVAMTIGGIGMISVRHRHRLKTDIHKHPASGSEQAPPREDQ
jgi:hypothetical protein